MDTGLRQESTKKKTRIAVVHAHKLTREVMARTLARKLDAVAVDFSCFEDLLHSSMNYDVFLAFSDFGPTRMDQQLGIKWIKQRKPDALVLGMLQRRHFDHHGLPPSSDLAVFSVADDLGELAIFIRKQLGEGPHTGASEEDFTWSSRCKFNRGLYEPQHTKRCGFFFGDAGGTKA